MTHSLLAKWADQKPIDMVLYCPKCGTQHVDAPMTDAEYSNYIFESKWVEVGGSPPERWTNPPHKSHLCAGCGHVWRPSDTPTNGIASCESGKDADTIPANHRRLVEMLERLEFSVSTFAITGKDTYACPCCGASTIGGLPGTHEKDCELAALLGER